MKELLVIVPSRGRPDNFLRLVEVFKVAEHAEMLVCQDNDDEPYPSDGGVVRRLVGPRKSFATWLNYATSTWPWIDQYPFVGAFGDDHCPQAPGWDKEIIDALKAMGTGMVYANDLHQGERLSTTIFMTANIFKTLGYFAVPGFHQYCDPGWFAMGKAAGCLEYLPDVVIEHLHPHAGKAEMDKTYMDSLAHYHDDMAVMEHYRISSLGADVDKLRALRG